MEIQRRVVSLREACIMYGCSKMHLLRQIAKGTARGQKVGNKWFLDPASLECLFLGKCEPVEAERKEEYLAA